MKDDPFPPEFLKGSAEDARIGDGIHKKKELVRQKKIKRSLPLIWENSLRLKGREMGRL